MSGFEIGVVTALAVMVVTLGVALVVALRRTAPAPAESGVDLDTALRGLSETLAEDRGAVTETLGHVDRQLAELQRAIDQRDGAVNEQMGNIGRQMQGIFSMFTNDRQRGNWGEITLARIFEAAGMVEGVDYEKQYTQGENRPDVVVFLPGDNRIVIDSKFPTTRYLEAMAVEDPDRRHQLLREHGKELEKVGRELVKKHYQDMSTAGYVVMYVPSQDLFEAAVEAHSDLIDRLMAIGVIVAGPVNVFALLKTAATIVAQHRAVKDAHLIIDQVKDVRNRLGVFAGHFGKIRSGLAGAVDAFNKAVGSWNSRLAPAVTRLTEMSNLEGLGLFEEVAEGPRHDPASDLGADYRVLEEV